MELINAFCVFQRAGGTKRGSYYYLVIGAYKEGENITHLAYEAKFDPTNANLKFENLKLNFDSARRTTTGFNFLSNPLSDEQQRMVNRAIILWLRQPSEHPHCKDKETGADKANFHYKALGMGKFFITPYGKQMDKMEWDIFCLNIGSDKVRCIMRQKQMM